MYETYYGLKCTEWLCHFKDGRVKCRKANYHVIDNQYHYWPADKRQICNSLMWIHITLFSGSYFEVYFFIHGLNLTLEQPCRCWSWRIRRVTVCLDYLCVYIQTPVSGESSHVGNRSRSKSARRRSGCVIPYGQSQSVVMTLIPGYNWEIKQRVSRTCQHPMQGHWVRNGLRRLDQISRCVINVKIFISILSTLRYNVDIFQINKAHSVIYFIFYWPIYIERFIER